MTSKPEGPGKDASRPADPATPKRPHATLDLKATEIEIKSAEPAVKAEAKPEPAVQSGPGKPAEAKPSDTKSGPDVVYTGAKPQGGSKAATGSPGIASQPAPRAAGGGRAFSHFLASLAGGIIALGGASWLSQGGSIFDTASVTEKTRSLEARLASLEQAKGAPATDTAVSAKLQDTAARLDRLDTIPAMVDQLRDAQGQLAAETRRLIEKAGQNPLNEAAAARIAKLEDRLAVLSAAAGPDGDKGGRIPQLANITGRMSELESNVANQLAAMRKTIPDEVANRLGTVAEASEAARAGAQRTDRELQTVKTDVVKLGQRAEALKADSERITQTLDVMKEDQGRQTSALDGLKSSVETQLKSVSRAADVASAVAPVAGKLASLESNLESVVKSERDRKADAERIVVSLELANLKRALDSGQGYGAELAAVRKASGGKIDLSALDRYQSGGLPAMAELEREFRTIAYTIIDAGTAPADAGVVDRLIAGAKSVVRVRKVDHSPDDKSVEAVVSRMESALKEGHLGDALEQAKDIPAKASGRASEWLIKAQARNSVDRAIATVEGQLKASLSGAAAGSGKESPAASSN